VMRNLSLLNILWDGGTLSIGRRSSESFSVRGARLTVALQIQESTLREFFDRSNGLARGIGFLARFLFAWPTSTQGYRLYSEAPATWPALATFNKRVRELLERELRLTDDTLTPAMLQLSADAKAAWVSFHDQVELELRGGGELHDVRDVASKAADNVARLAALVHEFSSNSSSAGLISSSDIESATRIVAWHLTEARRFFGELALPQNLANAARLDSWLLDYCKAKRTGIVPTRSVQQFGPGGLRDRAAIEAAARELESLSRCRLVQDGRKRYIEINPLLLEAA
jgi:putative DNA primase/helicase